jgi:hypothetical protein
VRRQPRGRRPVLAWTLIHLFTLLRAAAGLAVLAGLIAAAASYHRPHHDPVTAANLSAVNLRPDVAQVLKDERLADTRHREAWIADGWSSDLQVLASDAASGGPGSDIPFSAQAQSYLDDYENGGLTGNWPPRYASLRAGLNALAARYGLAPVPAPGYLLSGARPALHPWPVRTGSGCTVKNTVTDSSSSTGASSHSVKSAAKCGTTTTTVTNKTAVSKTGAVTDTTTTSTASGSGNSSSSSGSGGG